MSNAKITLGKDGEGKINSMLNRFLNKIGNTLVSSAKGYAPVDTGLLKSSIEVKGVDYETKTIKVGSNVEYAIYQELGTSKMGPQPYLRPSLDNLPNNLRLS